MVKGRSNATLRWCTWDHTGRGAWLRGRQLGVDGSPTHQLTSPPHLLHRYCDQLTKWGTVGSYWRSDAPGRLGMPGKWDRNSNRGMGTG